MIMTCEPASGSRRVCRVGAHHYITRYALVPDSDGAGRRRGVLGLRRDYLFPRSTVTFPVLAGRDREGPWGLYGGLAGRPAEYVLKQSTV
jgi:N-methylhydantoinase B